MYVWLVCLFVLKNTPKTAEPIGIILPSLIFIFILGKYYFPRKLTENFRMVDIKINA